MTATTRLTARRFRLEVAVPGRLAAAFLCAVWLIAGNEVSAGEKEYAVKGMVDEAAILAAGVDPQARPETLSAADFARLITATTSV